MMLQSLVHELAIQVLRTLYGQLFTKEQIRQITQHSLGRYFAELFPGDEKELDRTQRLAAARQHMESAARIMSEMRLELEAQTETLEELVNVIEEKKTLAQRYSALAQTNHEAASAMRMEMEEVIGQELVRQSERGKTIRQVASAVIWGGTLVLGAALGTYFKDIVAWIGLIQV